MCNIQVLSRQIILSHQALDLFRRNGRRLIPSKSNWLYGLLGLVVFGKQSINNLAFLRVWLEQISKCTECLIAVWIRHAIKIFSEAGKCL